MRPRVIERFPLWRCSMNLRNQKSIAIWMESKPRSAAAEAEQHREADTEPTFLSTGALAELDQALRLQAAAQARQGNEPAPSQPPAASSSSKPASATMHLPAVPAAWRKSDHQLGKIYNQKPSHSCATGFLLRLLHPFSIAIWASLASALCAARTCVAIIATDM